MKTFLCNPSFFVAEAFLFKYKQAPDYLQRLRIQLATVSASFY